MGLGLGLGKHETLGWLAANELKCTTVGFGCGFSLPGDCFVIVCACISPTAKTLTLHC